MMLQIRRLKRHQINEETLLDINRLWLQLSPKSKPLTLEHLRKIARQKFYYLAVIKFRKGPMRIVAMSSIHFVRDFHGLVGYVGNVIVAKKYRDTGIGSKVEEYLVNLARYKGAVFINATSNDKHAPEFWLKCGWKKRETNIFRKYL